MLYNKIGKKVLVVGIIILLVGISVIPICNANKIILKINKSQQIFKENNQSHIGNCFLLSPYMERVDCRNVLCRDQRN